MDKEKEDVFKKALSEIKSHYLIKLSNQQNKLNEFLVLAKSILGEEIHNKPNALTEEKYNELVQIAHQMAGTGSTFGFQNISQQGKILEDNLRAAPYEINLNIVKNIQNLIDACQESYPDNFDSAKTLSESLPHEPTEHSKKNESPLILVVDDDENIIALLKTRFHLAGYNVITATNVDQAFKILQDNLPNLILLDRMMPGSDDGLTLVKKMQEIPRLALVPVIILSKKNKDDDILKGFKYGVVDYVVKPFNLDVLLERCARMIALNEITKLATIDIKTNANNFLSFKKQADICFGTMARYKSALLSGSKEKKPEITFIAIDLDGFKKINDQFGHNAGDIVLKNVVAFFTKNIRPQDFFARVGGDEFAIIMNANAEKAHNTMQRLRIEFEKNFTSNGNDFKDLSYSYGIRQLQPEDNDLKTVIEDSDQAQIQDKNQRRLRDNR